MKPMISRLVGLMFGMQTTAMAGIYPANKAAKPYRTGALRAE